MFLVYAIILILLPPSTSPRLVDTLWLWTRRQDAGTIAASIEADLKVCQAFAG